MRFTSPSPRTWAGEPFVIAKAGKPFVTVRALEGRSTGKAERLGFLEGCIKVPDDFDRMGQEEIEGLLGGKPS